MVAMKVTGYAIREGLRRWQLRRDSAYGQFKESILAFPDEAKPKPIEVSGRAELAEGNIARLQAFQARYNAGVTILVRGVGEMSLLQAVKAVGGLGRLERMWRQASASKDDRYGYRDTRQTGEIRALRQVSFDEAAEAAATIGRQLGAYREAIAAGNATEVTYTDLDAALFE